MTYLVGYRLSIGSALLDAANSCRTRSKSRTGNAEGVHDDLRAQLKHVVVVDVKGRSVVEQICNSRAASGIEGTTLVRVLCVFSSNEHVPPLAEGRELPQNHNLFNCINADKPDSYPNMMQARY